MRYIIFHKNHPVIPVILGESYRIESAEKPIEKERVPVGLYKNGINITELNDWFFKRGIPKKRKDLNIILENNGSETVNELIVKNMGLGLTDNYWIKKENDLRTWEELNFFDNNFSQNKIDIYLGRILEEYKIEYKEGEINPSNVSSGALPKAWIKENNILYMLKGSELPTVQEPFNEKIVSDYLALLNVKYVPYELVNYHNMPYSKCPNMLNKDEELVHSYYVKNLFAKNNNDSYFEHYIKCCESMGIKENVRKDLEDMILIDYLTANTDRHWSNFGVIRNSETLQAVRLAPIYDNGASLFAKTPTVKIKEINSNLKCQSFKNSQKENIKQVNNFSLLENKNIDSLVELVKNGYDEQYVDQKRSEEIAKNIEIRISDAKNVMEHTLRCHY